MLLNQFERMHDEYIKTYRKQLEQTKAEIAEVFENALRRLKASNEMIQSLPSNKKLKSAIRKRAKLLKCLEEVMHNYEVDDERVDHEEPETDVSQHSH
jgi:hypothetical protein